MSYGGTRTHYVGSRSSMAISRCRCAPVGLNGSDSRPYRALGDVVDFETVLIVWRSRMPRSSFRRLEPEFVFAGNGLFIYSSCGWAAGMPVLRRLYDVRRLQTVKSVLRLWTGARRLVVPAAGSTTRAIAVIGRGVMS